MSYTYDDAECARILAMTHEEIIAEVRAQGFDPQKVIDEVDRTIAAAKVDAYRRRMKMFV